MDFKVLVVEDDPDARKVLSLVLKLDGFAVASVADGHEAIAYLEQNRPNLILLDVIMPEVDGYEVCRWIRNNPSTVDLPVVMLSGKNDEDSIKRGYEVGADDYLPKPIKPSTLTKRLRSVILKHSRQVAVL